MTTELPAVDRRNPLLQDDVVRFCRDLVRIDTSNFGDERTRPERPAAEYVAEVLTAAGVECSLFEARPGRTNVVARLAGADRSRPPLLVHGHLDVVPAGDGAWSVDPFGGELLDGHVWGRGAVDMKNMIAMVLAAVCEMRRTGRVPARDLVLAFLADEEQGGELGARFLVAEHADLFAGCTEAVSEIGGFSADLGAARRPYLVETGRKGVAWLRLVATGTSAHASLPVRSSAVGDLADAVRRITEHRWPMQLNRSTRRMLDALGELAPGIPQGADWQDRDVLVRAGLEGVADLVLASLAHVANVTVLQAGDKINVVPGGASAIVDARFLPGRRDEFFEEFSRLVGTDVAVEVIDVTRASDDDPDVDLVTAMGRALLGHDPSALVVPYTAATSSDSAHFADLGIAGYGFVPMLLPRDYAFSRMFHGVDERVPVAALQFGAEVMLDFLLDN